MIAVYSRPAHGYMSLTPVTDLGTDEVLALWKAGVRKDNLRRADGRALLVLTGVGPVALRLGSADERAARKAAMAHVSDGDVVVLEATYHGRITVWRRTEVLQAMSPSQAEKDESVRIVSPYGTLIEKALSPADAIDAKIISSRLAGQLLYEERRVLEPKLRSYIEGMNVDWTKIDQAGIDRELAKIRSELRTMLGPAAASVMPTWKTKVESTLTSVFKTTRQAVRDNFLPSVGVSLKQPDLRAIGVLSEQQGWFLRDSAKVRSDALTARARVIVEDGLKRGLGRNEIGANLHRALPQAWQGMGQRYFNVVAANAVSRARSYSEVSGYIEVGIEALEVQAVLDERTTEICRCLDGTIIETNVVSQQIIGAMNVSTPEGIYDAAPFLKEVVNQQTGLKEIVTSNNGTRIAEVVRSGFGRADDRGQFNMFRQGNGLADAHIGPPPYHHLCRSWTIPVSSTVTVPREFTPRALDTPTPIPPRLLPRGAKPPAGVGPRPQTANPTPTPTNPSRVGDPDVVERYPFTQDFVVPGLPPGAIDPVTGELREAAYGQRFSFDAQARVIRATGKSFEVPRAGGGKHPLADLAEHMELTAQTSGVVLHVGKADLGAMRRIILTEAQQPLAVRVYSVRAADTGANAYLRFDHNVKGGVKNQIRALRKATTDTAIQREIAALEKRGFLKVSGRAQDVTFGAPAPKMPPAAKPPAAKPPAKRPGPPAKPKPLTEPTVRPKPKPTTTEVTPTGQIKPPPTKPAPPPPPSSPATAAGPVTDYSQYGLLKNVPVDAQVSHRMGVETARLRDYLKVKEADFQRRLGRSMNRSERGLAIRDFVAADTGPVSVVTNKMVAQHTAKMTKQIIRVHQTVARDAAAQGTLVMKKGRKWTSLKLEQASYSQVSALMNDAFEHLSQRVLDKALESGLPTVFYAKGVERGAYYMDVVGKIVVLPDPALMSEAVLRRAFRHEWNHFVEVQGKGVEAAKAWRSMFQTQPKPVTGPGYKYVEGQWTSQYTGKISEVGTEVTATTGEWFAKGEAYSQHLSTIYQTNPEQVGYYMAHAKGSFIP